MPGAGGKGSTRKTMTKKPMMISKPSDEKSEEEEDEEIVCYRRHWENCYGKCSGSFEDTSKLFFLRLQLEYCYLSLVCIHLYNSKSKSTSEII